MSGSLQLPDATIPLQAGRGVAPPANPFEQLGRYADTQNALLNLQQNRIAIQQKQALGSAFANATIDPVTGLPDMNGVVQPLQSSPAGALMIPTVVSANQAARLQSYALNKAAFEQTQQRTAPLYNAMSSLAGDPSLTPTKVYSTISGLAGSGLPTETWMGVLSTMPHQDPAAANNPQASAAYTAQLQKWARGLASRGWDGGTQAAQFTPHVATVDQGGVISTYDQNPNTNPGSTNLTFSKSLSPPEAAAPTQIGVTATGAPVMGTLSQFVAKAGGGYNFGSGRPGGSMPPALIGPNGAGAAASAPLPGAAPGGGIITGLSPAQTAGQTAAATASAGQWAAANQAAGGSAGRIYQLNTALNALQNADTGPGTDQSHAFNSFLLAQAPALASAYGITPDQVASYDEANKYLTAYACSAASKFGATTDSQLATALSANASTHISNLAATNVVKANLGLEAMNQDLVRNFQNGVDPATGQSTGQTLGPEQFSNYASQWNSNIDARADVMPYLPQAQATQMISGMSPPDQAKFYATYQRGINSGSIQPPAWAQPQQGAAPSAPSAPAAQPDQTQPAPVQDPAQQGTSAGGN